MARADDKVQCIIKARSFPLPKTMWLMDKPARVSFVTLAAFG
jgi:hypothetical protein